jgi:hypothetical protein
LYGNEDTGLQNFVISVNARSFNMKPLIAAFDTHHREQYRQANLTIEQKQLAGNQLMIVHQFKTKAEAISYFTQTITNRRLYRSLDTLSYRNFIITDANLKKMLETQRISDYLNFFKTKYIGADDGSDQQSAVPQYDGPYKTNITGTHNYVLIVPRDEINVEKLEEAIKAFNTQNYAGQPLAVKPTMLDDFRLMMKVEGLPDDQSALAYLRAIASDQRVFGPLQQANYRNFVITPENEAIFRQNRNINIYMEFYRKFYLKQ